MERNPYLTTWSPAKHRHDLPVLTRGEGTMDGCRTAAYVAYRPTVHWLLDDVSDVIVAFSRNVEPEGAYTTAHVNTRFLVP